VTGELASKSTISRYGKPTVIITNGLIGLPAKVKSTSRDNGPITFGFVGSPNQHWHGIDKIIYLANHLKDYNFNIIGPDEEDVRRIHGASPEMKNIKVHGYLDPEKTFEILSGCDLGISTLSIHKNRMQEACPLKTREYLSIGLPVVIGYRDPDLENGFEESVLNIGIGEDNVRNNLLKIKSFANRVRTINPEQLAHKAWEAFDPEVREKARMDFFESIHRSKATT
jgi:glycosyltransferase involved in cell wall biosynthesis